MGHPIDVHLAGGGARRTCPWGTSRPTDPSRPMALWVGDRRSEAHRVGYWLFCRAPSSASRGKRTYRLSCRQRSPAHSGSGPLGTLHHAECPELSRATSLRPLSVEIAVVLARRPLPGKFSVSGDFASSRREALAIRPICVSLRPCLTNRASCYADGWPPEARHKGTRRRCRPHLRSGWRRRRPHG